MSEIERQDGHVTIKPDNDITSLMAQEFKEELQALIDEGIKLLAIDMTDVAMIDSIGLGVLIATHNCLNKNGGKLSVNHVSDHIFSLFKTMRLDKHFDVNLSDS